MLSLYKLEIFAAVIQEGSFSAAAKRLPMTQPAVSQHIQDLEATLGAQLFNRNRRGAVLTPAGEVLYDYTQRILKLVVEAEAAVTNVDNLSGGQTSIMATPGINVYLLPEWIGQFRLRYPNLGIHLQTGVTTEVVDEVTSHAVELGFVEGELDGVALANLGYLVLRDVEMWVVVGMEHEWAKHRDITLDMLNNQAFITRQTYSRTRLWLDKLFSQYNIKPHIVGEFDNPESIKQAVLSNVGVTILPDYAIRNEVKVKLLHKLPIQNITLRRQITLLWEKNRPFSPISKALLYSLSEPFPAIKSII
jgi:DNA-binding transcriptional LysR family regulator